MSLNTVFFNSANKLRSGWRTGIFLGVFLLSFIMFSTLAFGVYLLLDKYQGEVGIKANFILGSTALLAAGLLAGLFCTKFLEGLPLAALGVNLRGWWWRDLLLGLLLGAGSLLLAAAVAALGGGLNFVVNAADANAIFDTVIKSFVIFAAAAAAEEVLFRGYALQTFFRARLMWVGALLTSLLFAWVHSDNDNVSAMGLLNTALAGIWFFVAYLKTRTLWFAFGIHWAWNWMMAAIIGLPVSGITKITPQPILRGVDTGPAWLTGGQYGLEGGAACTAALVISTLVIWFLPFLKPTPEMLALTSQEAAPQNEKI